MNDVVAWYRSRTVWGALVAVLASLAHFAGVGVTAAEEAEMADLIVTAAGALGGIVALLGRLSARRRAG
ncbi:hypothetical protein [Shinella pollutisoli]|uniref:Uncharacterized protein n=1 Tax=Shinella pollutisoli TaxID=2250594 RepID=A0ABV7DM36_9HYPH|nr:hypothetical protein [Shinella pollutisoli]